MPQSTRVRKAMIQQLENLHQCGLSHLPKSTAVIPEKAIPEKAIPETAISETVVSEIAADETPLPLNPVESNPIEPTASPSNREETVVAARGVKTKQESLKVIQQEVAACQLCEDLASTRTQTVFGVGNPKARLVFLGEAPGASEDEQGIPFVGHAGQLLTKIIEACTLSRDEVYILNILKCRPPDNRNPTPQESTNCRTFLDRQLASINPEYICCLGAVAAHNLLETDTPIGKMRGNFYEYQGIQVLCTYHPAYLLRNPSAKKFVWEDMQLLMEKMGIEIP